MPIHIQPYYRGKEGGFKGHVHILFNNEQLAFVTKCPTVSLPTCLNAHMVN